MGLDHTLIPTWTAQDYLLRNEFCPPEALQAIVRTWRANQAAQWLVVIAYDRNAILRSLVFADCVDMERQSRLDHRIREARFAALNTPPFEATNDVILGFLTELEILETRPVHIYRLTPEHISREGIGFIAISDSERIRSLSEADAKQLAEMLNGTMIANVRRDQRITRHIEDIGKKSTEENSVSAIINLAARATGAMGGCYYGLDPATTALVLEARTQSLESIEEIPLVISIDSKPGYDEMGLAGQLADYARRSFRDTATYAFPPFTSHDSPGQLGDRRSAAGHPFAFITAVVPRHPLKTEAPNYGVIALFRTTEDPRDIDFSMFDMALVRNVCLRMSLLHNLSVTSRAAHGVERLVAAFTASPAAQPQAEASHGPRQALIPRDFSEALRHLDDMAGELRAITRCSSVTVRALTTARIGSTTRLVLRRVTASPASRLFDTHSDILLHGWQDGVQRHRLSTNAYAAVTGRVAHVPDTSRRPDADCPGLMSVIDVPGRPLSASEVTAPIIIDGFPVGSVHLESPVAGAFASELPFCKAFASMAAVAIAVARARIVRDLAQTTARLSMGIHESEAIERLLGKLEAYGHEDLSQDVQDLREVIFKARKAESSGFQPPAVPVRQVLQEALEKAGNPSLSLTVLDKAVVSEEAIPHTLVAVQEILRNVQRHRDQDKPSHASVRDSYVTLNQRRFRMLTFPNTPGGLPSRYLLAHAYHAPVYKPQDPRPHLGCYAAGEALRYIGGNVFLAANAPYLETLALLPTAGSE